jgi:hypothetical protein
MIGEGNPERQNPNDQQGNQIARKLEAISKQYD